MQCQSLDEEKVEKLLLPSESCALSLTDSNSDSEEDIPSPRPRRHSISGERCTNTLDQHGNKNRRRFSLLNQKRKSFIFRKRRQQQPEIEPVNNNRSGGSDNSCSTSTSHSRSSSSQKKKSEETEDRGYHIRLLRNERLPILGYHAYRAAGVESRFTSTDIDATVAHLKQRCRLIEQANPWVLGRLETVSGGSTALWVPSKEVDDEDDIASIEKHDSRLFQVIRVEGTDLSGGLEHCHVQDGYNILNQDVGIAKVCVIRSKDESVRDLIVTVSVSHVIGETTMVYALWGMLNQDAEIKELIPDRVHNFRGRNPISGLKGAGLYKFLWFLGRSNASPIGVRNRPVRTRDQVVVSCYEINMEWVQQRKDAHDPSTPGAPYLSTQDIITEWFFKQWNTACVGVSYDMRNRAKQVTDLHMGNYHEVLVLYPKEYRNAVNVRRVVSTVGRWQPKRNRPGKENPRSVGWITGWHSRHVDLELPYCERKNHLPLRDGTGQLPITKSQPWLAIFKTSSTQYAIWSLALEDFKDKSALGQKIEFD